MRFYKPLLLFCATFVFVSLSHAGISFDVPRHSISLSTEADGAVFKGATVYGEPGEPELPVYSYTFLVPPDADLNRISVSIKGLSEEPVPGTYAVRPGPLLKIQNETIIPEGKTIVDGKDMAIYSTDAFFPASYAKAYTTGQLCYYKTVTVDVYPYVYNPVTGQLRKLAGGTVALHVPTVSNFNTTRGTVYPMDPAATRKIKLLVANYDDMAAAYASYESNTVKATGLAIITTNAIKTGSAQLNAYIAAKEKRGYTVTVATETQWGTGSGAVCDKVRAWLKSNYQTLGIRFVLLIGNPTPSTGDLAMYKGTSNTTPTDWYYSELSGSTISSSDYIAEVHVGRIPVYSTADIQKLDKILTKTIAYENAPLTEIGWRFKALLSMKPIDNSTQAYELGEQIKDSTLKPMQWKWYRVYEQTYNLNPPPELTPCNATNTQKAWKEQRPGIVGWDTHGQATSSSAMITVNEVPNLDDTYPVFTFQGACLNAKPDVTNNLCYAILVNGGIVTHGGTISVGYTPGEKDYTKTGSIGGQEYWWAKFLIRDSLADAEAVDMARAQIKGKSWSNHLALATFGDPTISPYSCETSSTPYIRVTYPNGKEILEQGNTFTIAWNDNIDGNVKIELLKAGTVNQTIAASAPSNGSYAWNLTTATVAGAEYKIKITSIDSAALFDQSDDNFSVIEEYIIKTFPYLEDYEKLDTGTTTLSFKWEQPTADDLNWTVWRGKTPTKYPDQGAATGPDGDHTTTTGKYIYVESSGSGNPTKKADFTTPKFCFKALSTPQLTLWYHMFSNNAGADQMGDLYLDVCVDGTWKNDVFHIAKNQGDVWKQQVINLTPYKADRTIFRVRAVTGTGWASDICIDDFKIAEDPSPIHQSIQTKPAAFDLKYYGSRIHYTIPENAGNVPCSIKLFTMQGKLIKTVVNTTARSGAFSLNLDNPVTGLYLCTMETAGFTKTITILSAK